MKLITELKNLDAAGRAVTIGKFDGIHVGHQKLIGETVAIAKHSQLRSTVVTFDRNPSVVLGNQDPRPDLIGRGQKFELIQQLGSDELVELCFDEELSKESAEEFVARVLVGALGAKHVVVGKDFRFGSEGTGNAELLKKMAPHFGFEVSVVEPISISGEVVSSTRIRALLDAGEVVKAAQFLGRLHSNKGIVEHGLKIGRQLGFPTANMSRDSEGYLPKDAVYAGWLIDGDKRYPAALSVGVNETIQAVPRLVEAHVLDHTGLNFYDREVVVEYVEFIRNAFKFKSVEELIDNINLDLDK